MSHDSSILIFHFSISVSIRFAAESDGTTRAEGNLLQNL